jgi:dihydroflavonol-4-reductase
MTDQESTKNGATKSEHGVLVTGATGFLGRHLLRALRAKGLPAVALVRSESGWKAQPWKHEAGDVRVVEGTPLDSERWREHPALQGVRTIVHAAGIVSHSRVAPEAMMSLNIDGTLAMVRLAAAIGARLVFVSSSGTVGCFPFKDMTADEGSPYAEPIVSNWPYYVSKIRAERDAQKLAAHLGVSLSIVRPPVLLGPDDHRHRSTGYVKKVLLNKVPAVPRGGMNFTDVRDVAAALVRLCSEERPRPIYHLPGHAMTLREFFDMVIEVSGAKPIRRPMPPWATRGLARVARLTPKRPSWIPDPVVLEMSTRYWGLSSLFASELDYSPRLARQTLSDTVSWLRTLDLPIPEVAPLAVPEPVLQAAPALVVPQPALVVPRGPQARTDM